MNWNPTGLKHKFNVHMYVAKTCVNFVHVLWFSNIWTISYVALTLRNLATLYHGWCTLLLLPESFYLPFFPWNLWMKPNVASVYFDLLEKVNKYVALVKLTLSGSSLLLGQSTTVFNLSLFWGNFINKILK